MTKSDLMPTTPSFPEPSGRRGGGPLEAAFDRVVSQDPLLGPLAGRHWLHRDLRLTLVTLTGAPLAWLIGGNLLVAGVVTAGFAALLVLVLWTAAEHGPADADRLMTGVRWAAVAMVAMALLVCWTSPATGQRPAHPAVGSTCTGYPRSRAATVDGGVIRSVMPIRGLGTCLP